MLKGNENIVVFYIRLKAPFLVARFRRGADFDENNSPAAIIDHRVT